MIIFSLILATLVKLIQPVLGIGSVQNFPEALDKEQEELCFKKKNEGDEEARQTLIIHNLRLVSHIVRKYYSSAKNQEDLISIGTIGLVKAIDTFNCNNGTRFATYASKCIQNEILMTFRAQKKRGCEVSINDTIDVDRDGNPLTYIDVLSSDENVAHSVEQKMLTDKALSLIEKRLTPRERQILIMRYGLYGNPELTQKQVAEKINISRSYVSRIEKGALEKLREWLS